MPAAPDPVLFLHDLESWAFAGNALAVLGHPISHSLSPRMHNAALGALAVSDPRFQNWRYFRFDIAPADLESALRLLHARKFRGLNLTVPHKTAALSWVEEIDPEAAPAGALNTLLRTTTGWRGFNTDGYGLATAVREDLGLDLHGTNILLLGAGGAARGAAVECLRRHCTGLWIANRTAHRRESLLRALAPLAANGVLSEFDPAAPADLPAGALVINATSAGLSADDPSPLDLATLPRPGAVFDMIYEPPVTALLRQAAALGIPGANGLGMLVHQGARALEIWTGVPPTRTAPVMQSALTHSPAA